MRVRSWALSRKRDSCRSPASAGGVMTREVSGCLITVPPLEADAGLIGGQARRGESSASIGRLTGHVNGNLWAVSSSRAMPGARSRFGI
jgi:hypothetical protein